jgi:hydrogenase maturation protease
MSEHESERSYFKMTGSAHPPILVVGLGNPILGDDGVGWSVVGGVRDQLQSSPVYSEFNHLIETDFQALGGLSLMERLVGYQWAIVVDAITTKQAPPGTISTFSLAELPRVVSTHLKSVHDASFQDAMLVGRSLGAPLPEEVVIVGIEADAVYDFSEELSAPVAAAVPKAEQVVLDLLSNWIGHPSGD